MHFRLIRLVGVNVDRKFSYSNCMYQLGDVRIQAIEHPPLSNDPGTLVLLAAFVDLDSQLQMAEEEILVPDELRRKLEDALEGMANLLAITHRCGRTISSIVPYIGIDPIDDEAKKWIGAASAIRVGDCWVPDRMAHILDLETVTSSLPDRFDGASLLAEALCQAHPTGRLHEYLRLFERAFARPARLVCEKLLAEFLQPLDRGFDQEEVEHWLKLRDLATHADRRPNYAVETDTRPVVNRMEQAAFDVLFNKEKWRDISTSRRDVFSPIYGSESRNEPRMFIKQGHTVEVCMAFYDGFGAYPLELRFDLCRIVPKTWFTKSTDIKESPNREGA
ncbi:MAG TPA: hypothetical protein VHR66_14090 [Gemmataceae bacterium]|jgi:hypothetical protein|nr:hypothetical protein [Gemmataceae bacterium]